MARLPEFDLGLPITLAASANLTAVSFAEDAGKLSRGPQRKPRTQRSRRARCLAPPNEAQYERLGKIKAIIAAPYCLREKGMRILQRTPFLGRRRRMRDATNYFGCPPPLTVVELTLPATFSRESVS